MVNKAVWILCLLPVLGVTSATNNTTAPPPLTTITQGQLKGKWMVTREGHNIAGFIGIPYAQPPVGKLRFKSPQLPKPWKGVYNATKDAPGCLQNTDPPTNPAFRPPSTSEDCLYLNVYTSDLRQCAKQPVMVFISGRNFEIGTSSSSVYGPDYFLDEDIVLVTLNYRLGALGFLSLDHPALPGNLGLKDMLAALKWVKENIAQFGGDPEKVTLAGESAGAIGVQYLMVSEAAKGLFRAVISQSLSSRSHLSIQSSHPQKNQVEQFTKWSFCPSDPVRLVECLRELPAFEFDLLRAIIRITSLDIKRNVITFPPVVELDCVEDAIITNNPFNTTTDIPLLLGVNQLEGLYYSVDTEKDKTDKRFKQYNENYKDVLPFNFNFKDTAENSTEVAKMMKNFYFEKANIDRKHYLNLVNMFSDMVYNYPQVSTARSNKGETYFYQLNYKGSNTIVNYLGSKSYHGVSHVDDLFHLFPLGGKKVRNVTESDTTFSKQLVKMWSNFVKYLDPTPFNCPVKWEPVSTSSIEFLNIGQKNFTMEKDFLKSRMDFWDDLPYRNKPQKGRPLCKK